MILHFIQVGSITTDKQHIEYLRPFVRVQEKEPPSPQIGFKVTAKWSSENPSKQKKIVVGHGLTTIFLRRQSIDLTAYP